MLYGSCTIDTYNDDAVLCVFAQDSRSWWQSEIEEFLVVQWTYRALCAAVGALVIEIQTKVWLEERFRKAQNSSYYVQSMHMPSHM